MSDEKLVIEWMSKDHIKLANIYMDAPDNISCFDGCLQSSFELMEENPEEAIKLIKKEEKGKNKMNIPIEVLKNKMDDSHPIIKRLIVHFKSDYGIERMYPTCETSKLIVSLFGGDKSINDDRKETLKKLGYYFQTEERKI